MKLKYYMRGIGIGMFVATIILVVAFAFTSNNISDNEIKERAAKLGMVEANATETSNSTDNSIANTTDNSTANATADNQTVDNSTAVANGGDANTTDPNATNNVTVDNGADEYVVVTIDNGESSRSVIEKLAAVGLVSDAYSFNKYMNDSGKDNNVQPGTFKIKKGISQDDLANLLVTKQKFREQP